MTINIELEKREIERLENSVIPFYEDKLKEHKKSWLARHYRNLYDERIMELCERKINIGRIEGRLR